MAPYVPLECQVIFAPLEIRISSKDIMQLVNADMKKRQENRDSSSRLWLLPDECTRSPLYNSLRFILSFYKINPL